MGGRHGKGAQIVTDLYEIQDVVQRYTDIISIIADVDVEVVDEHLVRIAGTGLLRMWSTRICPVRAMSIERFLRRENGRLFTNRAKKLFVGIALIL